MALLYIIDISIGLLIILQLACIAMQYYYRQPLLMTLENTLTTIIYLTIFFAGFFLNPNLFWVLALNLCIVILLILPSIVIYKKQPNASSLFINRCNLIFGYVLLAGTLTVQPLFPLLDINLIALAPGAISKLLPGIDWTMALSNLYLSYPLFYLCAIGSALIAYKLKKHDLARHLILLPLIPLILLAIGWLVIGIHFVLTGQFYIALSLRP